MGPVRQNPIQRTVRFYSYVCASHCAQLWHTILHRTDLIVFPLTLQTITTTPMMSIWGKGVYRGAWYIKHCCRHPVCVCVWMAAGDGQSLRYDLLGAEHARLAPDAEVVDQHSSTAAADRRQLERRLWYVWMAGRSVPHVRQEIVQGLWCCLL